MRGPVICVGSPVVDQVIQVPEDFLARVGGAKGGMELVDSSTMDRLLVSLPKSPGQTPGGSAGNTGFAMARLGMSSRFLGALGDDAAGAFFRKAFKAVGGDDRAIRIHRELSTAQCLSLVTPDAERTMRTHLGAATTLMPEQIDREDFDGCCHAHIEGYLLFNPDLMHRVLAAAKSAGCTISVDLASFEVVQACTSILPDLLADYVDMVFANEEEARAFSGSDDPRRSLELLSSYCSTVAVKLGGEGAMLHCDGDTCHVAAESVAEVVDTTGAGDFWAAGFLYGLLSGHGIHRAGAMGATLGAAVIRREGTALPDAEWSSLRTAITNQ